MAYANGAISCAVQVSSAPLFVSVKLPAPSRHPWLSQRMDGEIEPRRFQREKAGNGLPGPWWHRLLPGSGGHHDLAFHVPEWRAHMPRCAWRCHMTNFSTSSAGIPPPYPAALRRSANSRRIAQNRLRHNQTVKVLHNFDEVVEKKSRAAGKMRRTKVRASSVEIMQEHRQACVPGDGVSIFWLMWKKRV